MNSQSSELNHFIITTFARASFLHPHSHSTQSLFCAHFKTNLSNSSSLACTKTHASATCAELECERVTRAHVAPAEETNPRGEITSVTGRRRGEGEWRGARSADARAMARGGGEKKELGRKMRKRYGGRGVAWRAAQSQRSRGFEQAGEALLGSAGLGRAWPGFPPLLSLSSLASLASLASSLHPPLPIDRCPSHYGNDAEGRRGGRRRAGRGGGHQKRRMAEGNKFALLIQLPCPAAPLPRPQVVRREGREGYVQVIQVLREIDKKSSQIVKSRTDVLICA